MPRRTAPAADHVNDTFCFLPVLLVVVGRGDISVALSPDAWTFSSCPSRDFLDELHLICTTGGTGTTVATEASHSEATPWRGIATRSFWHHDASHRTVLALGVKAARLVCTKFCSNAACDGVCAGVTAERGIRTLTEARAGRAGFSNALRSSFEGQLGRRWSRRWSRCRSRCRSCCRNRCRGRWRRQAAIR